MSRERLLIAIGLLVMLAPFVGLPLSILRWFFLGIGLAVVLIGISYAVRKKRIATPALEV